MMHLHIVVGSLDRDELEGARVIASKNGLAGVRVLAVGDPHLGIFLAEHEELVLSVPLDFPLLVVGLFVGKDPQRPIVIEGREAAVIEADLVGALLNVLGCSRHVQGYVVRDRA